MTKLEKLFKKHGNGFVHVKIVVGEDVVFEVLGPEKHIETLKKLIDKHPEVFA